MSASNWQDLTHPRPFKPQLHFHDAHSCPVWYLLLQNVARGIPTCSHVGGPCRSFQRVASYNMNEHGLTLCLYSPLCLESGEVLPVVACYLPFKNPQ